MGYKEEIRDLENKLAMLEGEKFELSERKHKEYRDETIDASWYDGDGDHYHEKMIHVGPSENFYKLSERIEKIEKEIKETEEKLKKAKAMAPIKEKEEKEKEEQKEKEKLEKINEEKKQEEREKRERERILESIKAVYKSNVPRGERITAALQGRRPKWKKIKNLPIEELRFLKKASRIKMNTEEDIRTRDEQIKHDTLSILGNPPKGWDRFKYAERQRQRYFLKLLRVRAFLEAEAKKNSPENKNSGPSSSRW